MNPLATLLAWGAVLVLPACAHQATAPVPSSPSSAQCNAAPAQDAVGQRGSPELAELARRKAGANSVRLIKHGEMVTKEYLAGRLNLQLDTTGNVQQVYCG